LARTIIRKHDREYLYHCEKRNCGADCLFAAVRCPNPNCEVVFSKCWGPKHDSTCPLKIVDCDRACGESVARMALEAHKEHACALR
jgi:hypothetical protein